MPETYQQRFDRIMHPVPSLMAEESGPPMLMAGRSGGRLRGLLSLIQMQRQDEKDAMAERRMDAALARQDAQGLLARQREDRMADQFQQNQDRMFEIEKARRAHEQLMESLAAEQAGFARAKAKREDEKYAMEDAERRRFAPIYSVLMGEQVPGISVDPETLDTSIEMQGGTHKLPGRFVAPMLNKHFGYKLPTGMDPAAMAAVASSVADIASQSGVKLSAMELANLGKAIARNPSLLSALPDELEKEAIFRKDAERARNLISEADQFDWSAVPKDTRSPWNMASWFTDKPAVVALERYDEKNRPSLLTLDSDEAKEKGYSILSRSGKENYLDGVPLRVPDAPGPIMSRLLRAVAEPAPAAVGEVRRRTLPNGEVVNVKRDPSTGKWVEVE